MNLNLFKNKTKKMFALAKTLIYELGQAKATPREYGHLMKEGYQKNVICFYCVSLTATHAAKIPFKLFDGEKEIENHPILDLLNRPNKLQSKTEFFEAIYSDYLLCGNSYMQACFPLKVGETPENRDYSYRNEPPQVIYECKPQFMRIKPSTTALPQSYIYTRHSVEVVFPVTLTGDSNILHCKTYNPLDIGHWYGMSPLEAAAYSIDQHNAAGVHNYNILKNGGRPSGAVTVKDREGKPSKLNEAQYQELTDYLDNFIVNSSNSGRPLILDGGLEWTEMSQTMKDMDFEALKKLSASEIALAYNVPMDLINTQQAKYNNLMASYFQFYSNAVIPLVHHFIEELNHWLVPRYKNPKDKNKNLILAIDLSKSDAIIEMRTKQAQGLEKVSFLTPNEKRKILGYGEIEGADRLLVPFNLVPIVQAGQMTTTQQEKQDYYLSLIKEGIEEKTAKQIIEVVYK